MRSLIAAGTALACLALALGGCAETPASPSTSAATPAPVAAAPAATQASADKDPDRIICKSTPATGSLIDSHKTCLTARQWEQSDIDTQRNTQGYQRNTPTPGFTPSGMGGQ